MKKAVLFDIDGTILDTSDFVLKAVDFTIKKYDLKVSREKLNQAMGKKLVEYYKFIAPDEDYELFAKTHRDFQSDKFDLCKVFPGVLQTLKSFQTSGIKIAAVSNRSKDSLVKSLKMTGVYDFFDIIVSADEVENPKPHKDHPLKALEILNIKPSDTIIVGDTENDILAGKSAGIVTVGVTWGWIGQDIKTHNPDFVIDDMEELLDLVSNKLQN